MHCSVLLSKYLLLATSKDVNDGLDYAGRVASDAETVKLQILNNWLLQNRNYGDNNSRNRTVGPLAITCYFK